MTWKKLFQQKTMMKKKNPCGSLFRRGAAASHNSGECEKLWAGSSNKGPDAVVGALSGGRRFSAVQGFGQSIARKHFGWISAED
jgi:hypothetical protein